MTGISRKLPDTERTRLKAILKKVVPEQRRRHRPHRGRGRQRGGAARDVERLQAQWETIEKKAKPSDRRPRPSCCTASPTWPSGWSATSSTRTSPSWSSAASGAWDDDRSRTSTRVAPDLADRVSALDVRAPTSSPRTAIDEQLAKALDRKVWLPSRRLAGDRPHRGDDRRRRQHRQVHRLGRQPRGDGHPQQPRGRRGDRPPAAAARHRRHHRRSTSSTWCWSATATWCCAG